MSIKETLRILFAVLVGSLIYIPLVLIPLLGPLITGLVAGWISKTSTKRAFFIGVISGTLGFLFLVFIVVPNWNLRLNLFLWWIFFIWNLIAILFTGVGASFGSMISSTAEFFSDFRRFRIKDRGKGEERKRFYESEAEIHTFIICPNCGISNPEESEYCSNCRTRFNK